MTALESLCRKLHQVYRAFAHFHFQRMSIYLLSSGIFMMVIYCQLQFFRHLTHFLWKKFPVWNTHTAALSRISWITCVSRGRKVKNCCNAFCSNSAIWRNDAISSGAVWLSLILVNIAFVIPKNTIVHSFSSKISWCRQFLSIRQNSPGWNNYYVTASICKKHYL